MMPIVYLSMKNAQNTMGTKKIPEWHPRLWGAFGESAQSDLSVGEDPGC